MPGDCRAIYDQRDAARGQVETLVVHREPVQGQEIVAALGPVDRRVRDAVRAELAQVNVDASHVVPEAIPLRARQLDLLDECAGVAAVLVHDDVARSMPPARIECAERQPLDVCIPMLPPSFSVTRKSSVPAGPAHRSRG